MSAQAGALCIGLQSRTCSILECVLIYAGILACREQAMRITALPSNVRCDVCVVIKGGKGYIGTTYIPHVYAVVHHEGAAGYVIAADMDYELSLLL